MARKVVSRKEKRAEAEAAEASEETTGKGSQSKAAARPARKKKPAPEVRLKAYWGVFNQSLKRVALYEYSDRKKAQKRAKELSESGNKSPHFVQPVREVVKEE